MRGVEKRFVSFHCIQALDRRPGRTEDTLQRRRSLTTYVSALVSSLLCSRGVVSVLWVAFPFPFFALPPRSPDQRLAEPRFCAATSHPLVPFVPLCLVTALCATPCLTDPNPCLRAQDNSRGQSIADRQSLHC